VIAGQWAQQCPSAHCSDEEGIEFGGVRAGSRGSANSASICQSGADVAKPPVLAHDPQQGPPPPPGDLRGTGRWAGSPLRRQRFALPLGHQNQDAIVSRSPDTVGASHAAERGPCESALLHRGGRLHASAGSAKGARMTRRVPVCHGGCRELGKHRFWIAPPIGRKCSRHATSILT